MHELSVTQGMLEIVLRHAQRAGAQRITQIHLVIGDLTSIVDDSVQFYFDFISQDTIAKGAQLVFQRTPATFRCRDCGNTFTPDKRDFTCTHCGEMSVDVVAGNEFRVESIEVE
ncbi:MAG: hydrogenase maturation nickel metallochaperone HypA [Anaerolineae bacterium]